MIPRKKQEKVNAYPEQSVLVYGVMQVDFVFLFWCREWISAIPGSPGHSSRVC